MHVRVRSFYGLNVKHQRHLLLVIFCVALLSIYLIRSRFTSSHVSIEDSSLVGGGVSCRTRAIAALERASKLNKKYRVFIELTPKDVLIRQAEILDSVSSTKRGSLHCIIVAVKDNIETSTEKWSLRTTAGSAALLSVFPVDEELTASAPSVEVLEKEGILILGKATMDDFALQYHSFSTRIGQALNCHDPTRFPGGSSGGSAVAVSLGLVDLALGTDTGGSIRIPSSFAGVVGLRPSLKSISSEGVIPLSRSRDTVGPIARTVAMAERAFEIMARTKCATSVAKSYKVAVIRDLFTEERWGDLSSGIQALQQATEVVEISKEETPQWLLRSSLLKQTKSASMYEFQSDLQTYLKTRRRVIGDFTLESLTEVSKKVCEQEFAGSAACTLITESMEKKIRTAGAVPRSVSDSWRSTRDSLIQFMKENGLSALAFPAFTADPTRIKLGKKQEFCPNNRLAAITGAASLVVFGGFASSPRLPLGLEFVGTDECRLLAIGKAFERAMNHQDGSCGGAHITR